MRLSPGKVLNLVRSGDNQFWQITSLPASLELTNRERTFPSGWVLIRGRLQKREPDLVFKLLVETEGSIETPCVFELPVSRRGTILELLPLPEGTTGLSLAPQAVSCSFQFDGLSIRAVTAPERVFRMLQRVVPALNKYPRECRRSVGLSALTIFNDLQDAYRIVNQLSGRTSGMDYPQWLKFFDLLTSRDRLAIRRHMTGWRSRPRFRIIVPVVGSDPAGLMRTLDSLRHQLYRHFETILLVSSPTILDGLRLLRRHRARIVTTKHPATLKDVFGSDGDRDWIICLRPGACLAEHALYWLGHEINRNQAAMFIYADHDCWQDDGRHAPVFKPDWSPELLRATNYIGSAATVRRDVLMESGGNIPSASDGSDFHELFLRVTERLPAGAIGHIPALLWHVPSSSDSGASTTAANPVAEHLQRLHIDATVEQTPRGHFRVRYALPPDLPLVSIVVPTRNARSFLEPCVESVLGNSSYPHIELLVIDNQSDDPGTIAYLEEISQHPRVRILRYPYPFNYSAINNFAAQAATGEVLCLLNNDTVVITPDWIETMLGCLLQANVGAVGAKLLFADNRVQHAGVAVGPGGCANHLHVMLDREAPGYCDRAILPQELSAVTAACMMTWRKLFLDIGGLDRLNLPVAFNDVDYCLRLREAGFRVIWTPYAELYHHESVSRGKDSNPEKIRRAAREVAYMRNRWQQVMNNDPFYNPNLNYVRPDFSLNRCPVVGKPWHGQ